MSLCPDTVAVATSEPATITSQQQARWLAESLKLPLTNTHDHRYPLMLTVTAQRLELRATIGRGPTSTTAAEFIHGRMGYRRHHGGGIRQPIARAIGLRGGWRPTVLDTTAGLGCDAFVLATLGCQVDMLERSAIVTLLLQDGLRRAALHPATAAIVATRLTLTQVDALQWLAQNGRRGAHDVVYIDPMFPSQPNHHAMARKEMQLLRSLIGPESEETAQLLQLARCYANQRVVVKRPLHAPVLPHLPPTFFMAGSSTRFDVYLTSQTSQIDQGSQQ
ncbi:MAG: class I SAM-dependent methyltransferase [Magnetococcales bacterium]|nr:class I SAM-dependent methyltransferase [Magnetococcales bacterium]